MKCEKIKQSSYFGRNELSVISNQSDPYYHSHDLLLLPNI